VSEELVNPAARSLYAGYLQRLDRALSKAQDAPVSDLRQELIQHLDDLIERSSGDELDRVRLACAQLGEPSVVLASLIASDDISAGLRGWSKHRIVSGLLRRVAIGGRGGIVAGLQLAFLFLMLTLVAIAVLSPFLPLQVGLLKYPDGQVLLGFSTVPAASELLGWWRVPIGLLAGFVAWRILKRSLSSSI
jgi:hypothetical protein